MTDELAACLARWKGVPPPPDEWLRETVSDGCEGSRIDRLVAAVLQARERPLRGAVDTWRLVDLLDAEIRTLRTEIARLHALIAAGHEHDWFVQPDFLDPCHERPACWCGERAFWPAPDADPTATGGADAD